RLGVLLPGIVLGIIPYIWGVWAGNGWLVTLGFLFTLAAAGDFLMFWIIRGAKSDTLLRDHPDRVGCIAVSEGKIGS
ncbi:MAG: metalloprotease family protein, partial [Balneolaceae bacterium]